jgi:hypothetical protein
MSTKDTAIAKFLDIISRNPFLKLAAAEGLEPAAPVEFKATAKLADGTEIQSTADSFTVGSDVMVGGAPAADGEYIMEDGSAIVVAGGLVTEVKEATPTDMTSEQLLAAISELSEQHKTLSETLTAKQAELEALTAKEKAANTELAIAKAEVARLSALPAAASVTEVALAASKQKEKPAKLWSEMSAVERMASLKNN